MLHAALWQLNADLARHLQDHPFVRGLGDGTLDRQAFARYVAQDAFFLRAFTQAYALAAAKCNNLHHARVFHELMTGVMDELQLHRSYSVSLGINLDQVVPYAATMAYTNFLLRVAWHDSLSQIIAAMVPCMRVYRHLGQQLAVSLRPDHPYKAWIQTYCGDDFGQICGRLESLLDELATDQSAVRDVYRYAMQCELDFFSAPLDDGPSSGQR